MSKAASHFEILLAIKSQLKGLEDAEKGLGKLQKELGKIGETFAPGGIFKAAGLTLASMTDEIKAAVAGSTKLAESLGNVRDRLQIRPEVFQVLSAGAKEAGGSVESLQKGIVNLRQRLEDALGGDKAARGLFESLKLNPEQLANQSTEAQLESIGRALVSASDETQAFDAALDLLGSGAADNLPLLRRLGTDGFGALREEVERTRGIMGDGIVTAISNAEGRIEAAREKMTKGFAGLNVTILETKANVTEFLADHAQAIKTIGTGVMAGSVVHSIGKFLQQSTFAQIAAQSLSMGFGQFFKDFPTLLKLHTEGLAAGFKSLGSALASPFGAAFAVAAGTIIITHLTDAMVKRSEDFRNAIFTTANKGARHREQIKGMMTEADKAQAIADAEKSIKELEARNTRRRHEYNAMSNNSRWGEKGEKMKQEMQADEEQIEWQKSNVQHLNSGDFDSYMLANRLKKEMEDYAAASKETADWIKENESRILAAVEASELKKKSLEEQLAIYQQQKEHLDFQRDVALDSANGEKKRQIELQFKEHSLVLDQNITEVQNQITAEKEKQADAAKRTADETQRLLEEEQQIIQETRQKITGRKLDLAELELRKQLQQSGFDRAALGADFTKTEVQKRSELIALLQREVSLYDQIIAVQREERDRPGTTPDERLLVQQRMDTLMVERDQARFNYGSAKATDDPNSVVDQMQLSLTSLQNQFGTVAQQIAGTFTNVIGTAIDSVSQGITGVIMGTMTWNQALMQIGMTILTTVIQSIIKMAVTWIIQNTLMAAVSKAMAAANLAMNAPFALASSLMWATPATLATIATYGGAAAAAPGLIAASQGIVMAQSLTGFSAGGYTGAGGRNEVAGVVHRGEFVMPAHAVNRIGVNALESLAFDDVAPSYMGASAPALSPVSPNVNVTSAPAQVKLVVLDDPSRVASQIKNSPELQNVLADLMRRQIREVVPT